MATLQATEGTWVPTEHPGKPELWPHGLLLPPLALRLSFVLPSLVQVHHWSMPFVDTKGRRPSIPSRRRGHELWGTEVKVVTFPSWVV